MYKSSLPEEDIFSERRLREDEEGTVPPTVEGVEEGSTGKEREEEAVKGEDEEDKEEVYSRLLVSSIILDFFCGLVRLSGNTIHDEACTISV